MEFPPLDLWDPEFLADLIRFFTGTIIVSPAISRVTHSSFLTKYSVGISIFLPFTKFKNFFSVSSGNGGYCWVCCLLPGRKKNTFLSPAFARDAEITEGQRQFMVFCFKPIYLFPLYVLCDSARDHDFRFLFFSYWVILDHFTVLVKAKAIRT